VFACHGIRDKISQCFDTLIVALKTRFRSVIDLESIRSRIICSFVAATLSELLIKPRTSSYKNTSKSDQNQKHKEMQRRR